MTHGEKSAYMRVWYRKNREKRLEYLRQYRNSGDHLEKARVYRAKRRDATRTFLDQYKDRPCVDCGVRYNPWQMDFDHRDPAKKLYNVSRIFLTNRKTLEAEIAKCDPVCSNCHRDRTQRRVHGPRRLLS